MHLQYMKQETMDDLLLNYDEYKVHYEKEDREWFSQHFNENNSLMEYAKDFPEFTMDKDENFNVSDLKNIRIVYDALKELPLSVACDARLWTGLAHTSLWDYVWYRQHEEIEKAKTAKAKKEKIQKAFFCVGNGKRRSLFVNCLSRLWWTGYLVYDENRKNPYELAETLMYGQKGHSFASQIVLLSSRNFISNKHLFHGILQAILDFKRAGNEVNRVVFETVLSYFNNISAATVLDFLPEEEVRQMAKEQLDIYVGHAAETAAQTEKQAYFASEKKAKLLAAEKE